MARPHRRWGAAAPVLIAGALLLASCGGARPTISGEVEVLGSWSGAELEAFTEVVRPFEERTGVSVTYALTRDLRGVLRGRMENGRPPDVAGLEGPAHMRELAEAGALRDLGDVLDVRAYRSRVAPTFIELGTVDGRLVGVFLRSSAKGLIWYNPAVYTLGPPETWDELQRLAIQAANRAEREWCIGLASEESSGWPGTDLIEQFLLRQFGVEAYDRWIAGDLAWTSREVRRAFEYYGQMVADELAFGSSDAALETDFRDAGDPLFSDPPGCLFLHQGSFMPAFFGEGDLAAGRDFDFFPFPAMAAGASSAVIGGGDLFGLLTDSPAAEELMRYLVSDEAQSIWVAQGGSLSVSAGVRNYPDAVSRRAAELITGADLFRFDASDLMPPGLNAAFRNAVLAYTADRARLDAILAELEAARVAAYGQ